MVAGHRVDPLLCHHLLAPPLQPSALPALKMSGPCPSPTTRKSPSPRRLSSRGAAGEAVQLLLLLLHCVAGWST